MDISQTQSVWWVVNRKSVLMGRMSDYDANGFFFSFGSARFRNTGLTKR